MALQSVKKTEEHLRANEVYASELATRSLPKYHLPDRGVTPSVAYALVRDELLLDGNSRQNLAPALIGALANSRAVVLVVLVGMVAAMVPPVVSWVVGLYLFKMDPILLAGAVAGSRSSTTAMKALQDQTKSAVPAFGYPVPYALSAVVVLIYGYLAMVLS